MAKTKTPHQIIQLEDIKEACKKQVFRDWTLNSEVKKIRALNFAKLARDLGTTQHILKKQIQWHQTLNPGSVSFGAGRPHKQTGVNHEEINWAVRDSTLRHQVGCSLKARTIEFNKRFGRNINVIQLRKWYRLFKITRKKFVARVGAPKLSSEQEQFTLLRAIKADMQRLFDDGFIVCQLDEACFSPKKNDRRHWAPANRPLEIPERWTSVKQIKACGVIC